MARHDRKTVNDASGGSLQHYRQTAVARSEGNPEGKGLSGFLLDWQRTEPRAVVAKPQRQVLAEFFTSMLVLSARFKFKPARGATYYLYLEGAEWVLSLIGPDEWPQDRYGRFAGTCELQPDMTWTIAPADIVGKDNPVTDAIARFYGAFAELLDTDLTLDEVLPFHVRRMPYWQRLHASALSRSIRGTIGLGHQGAASCRDWHNALPRFDASLLAHKVR